MATATDINDYIILESIQEYKKISPEYFRLNKKKSDYFAKARQIIAGGVNSSCTAPGKRW